MTARGKQLFKKKYFSKSCDQKKKVFYWDKVFKIRMFTLYVDFFVFWVTFVYKLQKYEKYEKQ
jgi:hypothetical protein